MRYHSLRSFICICLPAAGVGCGMGLSEPAPATTATVEQSPAVQGTDEGSSFHQEASSSGSDPESEIAAISSRGLDSIPGLIEAVKQGASPLAPESHIDAAMYASDALLKMGEDAVPALEELLEDDSPFVRTDAAFTLTLLYSESGSHGRLNRLVPVFITAMGDSDLLVRKSAQIDAQPLIERHSQVETAKSLVPPLIVALKEPRQTYLAMTQLGDLGALAKEAIPAIREAAANQDDPIIDEAAAEAIQKIQTASEE